MSEVIADRIAESAQELTEAQRAELDRRLADYEKHPDAGSSWAEVEARIIKRS
ncbi:MAG TPA: addiction module protein [Povalibacter sp.]|nr:addiction module protein [Povalibacter sp.]